MIRHVTFGYLISWWALVVSVLKCMFYSRLIRWGGVLTPSSTPPPCVRPWLKISKLHLELSVRPEFTVTALRTSLFVPERCLLLIVVCLLQRRLFTCQAFSRFVVIRHVSRSASCRPAWHTQCSAFLILNSAQNCRKTSVPVSPPPAFARRAYRSFWRYGC